jgi:hypothetical protein
MQNPVKRLYEYALLKLMIVTDKKISPGQKKRCSIVAMHFADRDMRCNVARRLSDGITD